MITTKTPFRMSFFGGGTDFPEFYREHGGAVLSTSFNKYCYVNVRHLPRFFEYTSELVYSKIERVTDNSQIEHPAIREAMKYLEMYELRLTYEGDLPARSGLGTSSSFSVGMLNAFYALKGKRVSKRTLADDAIYLERTLCGEAGGIQDQIAASFGGFNRIDFGADDYKVSPVILQLDRKKELNRRLMLFFTGFSRFSSDIQNEARLSIKKNESQLLEMLKLVDAAEEVLTTKSDLAEFGRLLDYTWKLKRNITKKVSTDAIDLCYEKAKSAGAVGGKLLGAGGGGFLLFYVEPEYQDKVRQILKDFLYIPFEFEEDGTRVIYYAPESFDLEGAR
ncbi:GHMP family kinase ATP-binding protein [Dorea sp. D27]|uniref:GHMP family kinase ATP-binding protein n=1 Tax=Dorea sp. D27 TaxID=658665 RepID=UPI0006731E4C|nr:kinase [Dorea sp. D27]KMZ53823.1 putative D-glycero-D-manno-heptose 7-phosphate kinase [Dorea sp. D27]